MSKKLAIAMFGQKRLSREGGVEIVVKELCTRMAQNGCDVTCYNRAGHHVSGAEYDDAGKTEYEGIRQKSVPTIERRGLAAVSSSAFAALYSAFGKSSTLTTKRSGTTLPSLRSSTASRTRLWPTTKANYTRCLSTCTRSIRCGVL